MRDLYSGRYSERASVQMIFQSREEGTSLRQELLSVICVLGRASAQTGQKSLGNCVAFPLPSAVLGPKEFHMRLISHGYGEMSRKQPQDLGLLWNC